MNKFRTFQTFNLLNLLESKWDTVADSSELHSKLQLWSHIYVFNTVK